MQQAQRGFSLVEMMVALVLGLIIIAGAGKILLANQAAFTMQRAVSEMQENAAFVMTQLSENISKAQTVTGDDAKFPATTTLLAASDELTLSYPARVAEIDCEGGAVAAGGTVTNRYYIADDNGLPGLFCDGSADADTTGVSMLRGVESFQVLVGEGSASRTNGTFVVRYVNSDQRSVTPGERAGAVSIGLLVRTEDGVPGTQPVGAAMAVLDDSAAITAAALGAVVDGSNNRPIHRLFRVTMKTNNSGA